LKSRGLDERRSDISRGQRLRKLVFGDWHPLLRDPLDLLRLSFAAAAIIFFLTGSTEYGVRMTATFLVLAIAQRLRLPRLFDLLFMIGMASQAWGNALGLFDNYDRYDNIVHFLLPLTSVPVLYVLTVRLGLLPDLADVRKPRQRLGLAVFAVMAGLSIGALYEVYEYVGNKWIGFDISIGYSDTIFDLTLDASGSILGGLVLILWAGAHWPTERESLGNGGSGSVARAEAGS
jgi:hypothetical protein